MRRILILFVFFSLTLSVLFGQHYRVGSGFTLMLPNDYLRTGGGFEIFVEYKTESSFSFRTNGGFVISSFKEANPYTTDLSYSLYWLDGSLIFSLLKSDYEPYIGGGIGYYFISTEEFIQVKTEIGDYTPQKLSNKFSFHVKSGFTIPLSESIKLHLQAKYLWLDRELIVRAEELIDDEIRSSTFEHPFDLTTIYLTIGVILKI